MIDYADKDSEGVSSVVSVVLIVGIVVGLASLVTVISFSVVDVTPNESPKASFELSEERGEIRALILRNENVESFTLQNGDKEVQVGSDVGSIGTLPLEESTYVLKASTESGTEQVLDTLEITPSDIEDKTIGGSVNINPAISDAKVKILDQETGSIEKTVRTDSAGNFETTIPAGEYEVLVNATDVEIQLNGETKNFYGGIWRENVVRGDDVQFNFEEGNSVSCQVNGKEGYVSFGKSSNGKYQVSNKYQTYCIDDLGIDGNYKLGRNIEDTTDNGLSDYRQSEILGTNPSVTDTDGDGITDKIEVQDINTNPNSPVTITDGFTDKQAYDRSDLDADENNVLVEVSYMDSSDIDVSTIDFNEIEQKFADNGFNLEFDVDDSSVPISTDLKLFGGYLDNYYNDSSIYSRRDDGYIHLLIVDSIGTSQNIDGNIRGVTSSDPNFIDGMMVEYASPSSAENKTEHFIMHELGHQLGLTSSTQTSPKVIVDTGDEYSGIDSQSVSCSNYKSVMNYNCQPNADGNDYLSTGYSDPDSGRDDWAIIEKYSSETNPINTDEACFGPDVTCEP